MAFILKDRVKENSTSTGTGNISLGGASATFDTFQSYLTNGDTTFYAIAHTSSGVDEWEVGLGTWNTGNTISRTTIFSGSNGTSAVDFSAGTKDIFMTYPASKVIVAGEDAAFANVTVTGNVDGRDIAADGSKLDGIDTSADVTDATTVAAAGALMRSGGTMTGNLILNADPNAALGAATKQYVDTIASAGIHYHAPVRAEHPSNLNATYNNGSSGVGATLTNAGTNAALVIDSVSMALNDRVLVANQTDQTQNGVYTVTTVGNGSTAWVLTRSTDTDTAAPSDPDAFGKGDAFFIKEGSNNAGHLDVLSTAGTIVFGTTNIVFSEVAETTVYSGGTGITLTGTTFSIGQDVATSANVTFNQVTAAIIGNVTGNLTGDVTGNSDTATALETARTIQLSGDVTGSASFDGSANINITAAVQDDSHAHVISNVDGLQSALDAKVPTSRIITAGNGLTGGGNLTANRTLTVGGGTGITVNANDIAIDSSYTGFDGRYYTETEADSRFVNVTGDTITGHLGIGGTATDSNWGDATHGNTEVSIDGGGGYGVLHFRGDGAGSSNTRYSVGVGDGIFYMAYDDVDGVHRVKVNSSHQLIVNETSGGAGEKRVFHDSYHPNADTLTTARTINGVSFNGSANITVADSTKLPLSGGTITGDVQFNSGANIHRGTHSSGHLVGSYNNIGANNTKSNPIYSIGTNYQPSDANLDNMYGVGYSNGAATFDGINSVLSGWGFYVAAQGTARIGLDGSNGNIKLTGTVDGVDIAARDAVLTTTTNTANAALPKAGGTMTGAINLQSQKINFISNSGGSTFANNHYSMGIDIANGSWSSPNYSDLIIGYHTGIRLGASYTGIRFYNNSPTTDTNNTGNGNGGEALIMTVGGTQGSHVNVNNNLTVGNDAFITGDLRADGGAGAITLNNSDIRSAQSNPTWTGNPGTVGKIQYHSNRWYIVSDASSNRIVQFRRDGADKSYIDNNGDLQSGKAAGWITSRTLSLTGAVTGSVSWNGTGNATLSTAFNDNGPNYIDVATGNYGTVKVDDDRGVTWAGYAIRDDWVFMSNSADTAGIYNDTDNEWALYFTRNAETRLYHNGIESMRTIGGSGIRVGSTASSDIYMQDTDHGERRIHCNSNRIGFLNSSSNWSAYSDDSGNWIVDYNMTVKNRLDVGSGTQGDAEIRIYKADNNVSDHIQFYNGTTRMGEIGCEDTSWLRINQETNKNIYTPRYIRADNGFYVDGTTYGITGAGAFKTANITPNANNTRNVGTSSLRYNTMYATTFDGTATAAQYADLAEKYLADAEYEIGTVIAVGGEAEVTAANLNNAHSVLGVVSEAPAFLMNKDLENGTAIALKGRVPVCVTGEVKKGDRLAPSTIPGKAHTNNKKDAWSFAIALNDAIDGIVEAVIL